MIYLDTNYILRFLVKDNNKQLLIATSLLTNENIEIYIPALALAEANHFLQSPAHYNRSKKETVSELRQIIDRVNIYTAEYVRSALDIYETSRSLSFYDCLILAEVTMSNRGELRTFDKKLEKAFVRFKNIKTT